MQHLDGVGDGGGADGFAVAREDAIFCDDAIARGEAEPYIAGGMNAIAARTGETGDGNGEVGFQ